MYLAMMLEDQLIDAGYDVLRAGRLDEAMDVAADSRIDGAILDVNLGGVEVYPLADQLRDRGVPFLFASAYGEAGILPAYRSHPILHKPYRPESIVAAVGSLLDLQDPSRH